jgi:predicted membrane protein
MLAIPNPQPERPPMQLLEDISSFLVSAAISVSSVVLLLLVLWAVGVPTLMGISHQKTVLLIGVLAAVAILVGVLGALLRG